MKTFGEGAVLSPVPSLFFFACPNFISDPLLLGIYSPLTHHMLPSFKVGTKQTRNSQLELGTTAKFAFSLKTGNSGGKNLDSLDIGES